MRHYDPAQVLTQFSNIGIATDRWEDHNGGELRSGPVPKTTTSIISYSSTKAIRFIRAHHRCTFSHTQFTHALYMPLFIVRRCNLIQAGPDTERNVYAVRGPGLCMLLCVHNRHGKGYRPPTKLNLYCLHIDFQLCLP